MSDYMKFLSEKIKKQEKNNEQIVLDYWEKVSRTGDISTKYESLLKKILNISDEESLTPQELASQLIELDGLGKKQALKYWVIKAERQNLNEVWKKEYITKNSAMDLVVLPKSGKNSLHLDSNFILTPKTGKKTQSDKSKGVKTFDFELLGSNYPNTEGFGGILVVDKTVKVTGGSQIDVQKEIDNTIQHLCNDPLKRNYLILLDGGFFYQYVQENKEKCDNIFFTTTDELINKKNLTN
jgi:hypothetical protein